MFKVNKYNLISVFANNNQFPAKQKKNIVIKNIIIKANKSKMNRPISD